MDQKTKRLWSLFQELQDRSRDNKAQLKKEFEALIKRYEEPHRAYHNVDHLLDLQKEFNKQRDLFNGDIKPVIGALFYHDAVYNCIPQQDEQQSADFARNALRRLGLKDIHSDLAYQMILDTASHQSNDPDTLLFLDMDMSILAADRSKYKHYVQGVTKEFCTMHGIVESAFKEARRDKFLLPVLKGGSIFKTPTYQPLEAKALANIKAELNNFS